MTLSRSLPEGVKPYASTKEFTAETVPDSLLKAHTTKQGCWGRLNVMSGHVEYFLEGADQPLARIEANDSWIILPAEVHFVKVSEDGKFFVEFCR